MAAGLSWMKSVLKPVAKSVLLPLGDNPNKPAISEADASIKKKQKQKTKQNKTK